MKDRQMPLDGAEPRIPFFSAALHCVAMTALVFLRSSFGFVYLRPKSVFFVFSWAFALFTIYAWIESAVWREYRSVCIFGVAAMTLYWIHLLVAFARQWGKQDQHDRYSGTSHGLRLMRKEGMSPTSRLEWKFHVLAEPAVVLFAAAGLRFVFGVSHLSSWLFFVAGCMWCKEALNMWFERRLRKRQKDIFDDALDTSEAPTAASGNQELPKATRKEPVKKKRNISSSEKADPKTGLR